MSCIDSCYFSSDIQYCLCTHSMSWSIIANISFVYGQHVKYYYVLCYLYTASAQSQQHQHSISNQQRQYGHGEGLNQIFTNILNKTNDNTINPNDNNIMWEEDSDVILVGDNFNNYRSINDNDDIDSDEEKRINVATTNNFAHRTSTSQYTQTSGQPQQHQFSSSNVITFNGVEGEDDIEILIILYETNGNTEDAEDAEDVIINDKHIKYTASAYIPPSNSNGGGGTETDGGIREELFASNATNTFDPNVEIYKESINTTSGGGGGGLFASNATNTCSRLQPQPVPVIPSLPVQAAPIITNDPDTIFFNKLRQYKIFGVDTIDKRKLNVVIFTLFKYLYPETIAYKCWKSNGTETATSEGDVCIYAAIYTNSSFSSISTNRR